jgi:Flp pilus assembly protein TadG
MSPARGADSRSFRRRRGATLVEAALVFLVFAVLIAGIMELGVIGFAANAITFSAHRAARFGSLRGSASGHAASQADIQASARSFAAPLNPANLTVAVIWLPDNQPGSSVQVTVSYSLRPSVLPLSPSMFTLQSTARQRIAQ